MNNKREIIKTNLIIDNNGRKRNTKGAETKAEI